MDRDTGALILLICFPLMLLIMLVLVAIPARLSASFSCPNCGRKIPKTDIQVAGIQCPGCDWGLKPPGECS